MKALQVHLNFKMNTQVGYLMSLAVEYIQKGDLDDAERLLKRAHKMEPKNSEILRLLGVNFARKKDLQEALKMFERSIKIEPKNWLAYSNQGNVLRDLNKFDAALKSYDKAIALQPNYAEAFNNKGILLQSLNKLELALENYDKAIALDSKYAEAYNNAGNTLKKLNLLDLALIAFEKAMHFGGNNDLILGSYINCKMQLCDWAGIEGALEEVRHGQISRMDKFYPFYLLSICDDPFFIKEATQVYMGSEHPFKSELGEIPKSTRQEKIRLGYFSPDFRNHAVSFLTAGLIEAHDKNKFVLIAFSMGPNTTSDPMRERLQSSFDHFIDVSEKSDKEVAQLAREMGVDIAIDLGGLTQDARPSIFAYRAAPIQIGYIGYLGTMGSPYMDYIIADKVIIPVQFQYAYTENIIYLPSYQVNDPKRKIADKIFTREELGLPATGFVYCCFNNNYKITPAILDSWALIMRTVDDSVIFLHAENMTVRKNLLTEFAAREIQECRVIFAERLPRDEYLARYRVADLFLDTSPYNAGTTASDALWAGLPVMTFLGQTFSAKMGGSILNAIGLPELVASSQDEYEALAIDLGRHPNKILEIKNKLAENLLTMPLFDTKLFTQNLELAFIKAYKRFQDGLPPDHIY